MENKLQKKNSLWKDICNIYFFEISLLIGIPLFILLFIFIPYYVGCQPAIISFFDSSINAQKNEVARVFTTWAAGLAVVYGPIVVVGIICCLIKLIVEAINDFKMALNIIKKLPYLPTTEEELKALNINTFDDFDRFMVDFFGIYKVASDRVYMELTDKLRECLELLPLPEAVAYLNNNKLHKIRYITWRSEILTSKILEQDYDYKCERIREEYESTEAKTRFLKETE